MIEPGNYEENRRRQSNTKPIVMVADQQIKRCRYADAESEPGWFKLEIWTCRPADPGRRLGPAQRVPGENDDPRSGAFGAYARRATGGIPVAAGSFSGNSNSS